MRQRVQRIKDYQVFNMFKFVQLLHLGQFYQQRTYSYKQYLYKQDQPPKQVYLIEEGDFQFTKYFEENQQNSIRRKLKQKVIKIKTNASKQKKIPIDFQQISTYNVTKPKKIKQYKIGAITGHLGQSIGQQEIILNKDKRIYNARCISTTNRVIIIKKQHLFKIFHQNQQLLKNLKLQYKQRQNVSLKFHKNIESTRNNMESFVKLLGIQKQKASLPTKQTQRASDYFKLPSLASRKNATEMKKKKSLSNSNWTKVNVRASNDSLLRRQIQQQINFKSNKARGGDISQNSQTFALTAFDNSIERSPIKQQTQQLQKNFQEQQNQQQDFDDSIPLRASKSWNNKQIPVNKFLPKQKYLGMIDSSALIRQKQYIISIRKNSNQKDQRIEFQENQKRIWKQKMLEKQRDKQATPAHSKQYMEKMLLNALKKAGYQEAVPKISQSSVKREKPTTQGQQNSEKHSLQQKLQNQHQQAKQSETKMLKRQKTANKMKIKKKAFFQPVLQVLQNNPFDECYFGKLK